MAKTLFAEMPGKISAQTLALKSFYEVESSATLLSALSEEGTLFNLSKRKFDLQLSLAPGSLRSLILDTLQESGNATVKMSDFLESPSQE